MAKCLVAKSENTQAKTDRSQLIVAASLAVFGQYGYARTRMEDIAAKSGVPRTALYRLFRSKEHVFLALVETVHTNALQQAKHALQGSEPLAQRLEDALIVRDLQLLQVGHSGPHANEIAEVYSSLAGDIASRFNRLLQRSLVAAIDAEIANTDYRLPATYQSAKQLALILRLALEGIKLEVKQAKRFESLARCTVQNLLS